MSKIHEPDEKYPLKIKSLVKNNARTWNSRTIDKGPTRQASGVPKKAKAAKPKRAK